MIRTRGAMVALVAVSLLFVGCGAEPAHEDDHGHAHHGDAHDHAGDPTAHGQEPERGRRGGRLFRSDGIQLELLLAEDGHDPQFLAWVYDANGNERDADTATLTATMHRFPDRNERVSFRPTGNHLRSEMVIAEPHSFRVELALEVDGRTHPFGFEQHEYRVELTERAVQRSGIVTQAAAPATIEVTATAPGEVRLNRERMLVVRPRFAGVVTEMRKHLGDAVRAGETLAVVQSNSSLTEYSITATMDGQIVARSGMVGAAVDHESVLYTLADLSSVWVDFAIYPQHVGVIQRGQHVRVQAATQRGLEAEGEVAYVGPLLEADTRVSHARIILDNKSGTWQPGLYVKVTALVDRAEVAVAVPEVAIVRSPFGPAVFRAHGTTFELQPIDPGRTDGTQTEVRRGLRAGDVIVVAQAYLLKAELGRGEASHDH